MLLIRLVRKNDLVGHSSSAGSEAGSEEEGEWFEAFFESVAS